MKIIFICGAYNAPSEWGREYNIKKAANVALDVWRSGGVAICPHLNSGQFFAMAPEYAFTEGYLEVVRRCDAIFLVTGWELSPGSRREVAEAKLAGLIILNSLEQLETYLAVYPKTTPTA